MCKQDYMREREGMHACVLLFVYGDNSMTDKVMEELKWMNGNLCVWCTEYISDIQDLRELKRVCVSVHTCMLSGI